MTQYQQCWHKQNHRITIIGQVLINISEEPCSAAATARFLLARLQYYAITWMCIASLDTIPTILDIHLTALKHSIYVTRHSQKCLLYVLTSSGRRFQEPCSMKFSKVPTFLCRHGAFVVTICLVANHGIHGPLGLNVQLSFGQPALKVFKAASICYVVHKQNTNRVAVIGLCDRPANKQKFILSFVCS